MPTATDIQSTVFKQGSAIFLARIIGADAAEINIASISAIEYSIYELNDAAPNELNSVSGHDEVSLPVGEVVFDSLQTDAIWNVDATGYNFRHEVDISSEEAFPTAGVRYQVRYKLTPTSGQPIIVRFKLRCI